MKVGPVFLLAALPLAAHAQGSLGLGVGTVRYAGGSSFSAATISPAAQMLAPSFYLGANGALSSLKDGVWAAQGRADLWAALSPPRRGPRLAVSLNAAASDRSDGVGAGAGYAVGEVLWDARRGGVALGGGAAAGVIEGGPAIAALRLRARGWWQPGGVVSQVSLSIEPTRLPGASYTDVVAGATVDRGRVVLSLWASARQSAAYGSDGAASVAGQYFLTPTIALEAAAGTYLRDHFQELPRAGYVSAGVRFHAARRPLAPTPTPRVAPPLIGNRRGDSTVVRFRMAGARSVAIAGDWNAWRPVSLRALGADIWEAALVLAPGTYHFSLLVDGTEWVVPGGVAVVSDGMGGMVAVLTVL